MSSQLLTVVMQAGVLSGLSNILAQGLTAYRSNAYSSFDYVGFTQMVILAILQTPPNYKWQMALEENFPSSGKKPVDAAASKKKDDDEKKKGEEKEELSITNTMVKIMLDQTVGASLNTIFFIIMLNLLRGAGWSAAVTAVQRDFYTMLLAGYKFWPFITLLNFVVIPVEQRMLVGNLAGLAWGVLVNLMGV
ncbi:uncharacterized protein A1O9_01417 [Exophiala aquamarina CBS 119918]|uniref:Protein Mpv17 n=1 Tax=Exophiala aquamarina CBS 119918 TaxID=1182545 RepID=A0A072PTL1_9EURO|nr:uncharacterized protein A1O9_01417 [Exophiala aquamarina CBS 119918]KEF63439.1 hypothetical protein A1O9_01417 [Exophiala aquamarina CBS 119918]